MVEFSVMDDEPVQRCLPLDGGGGIGVAAVGKQDLTQVLPTTGDGEMQRSFPALSLRVGISTVPQQL